MRRETGRAARCCSRAASSGGTATSRSSAARCPGGDEALQRLVWERLDEALDRLPVASEPYDANPLTISRRFDPRALTDALARGPDIRYGDGAAPEGPVIVATGGYPVRLARERGLLVRSNPWSEGDGHRARAGARGEGGAERRVLRPGDAGPRAGAGLRPSLTALRPLRPPRERPRRGVLPRRGLVVGERPCAGDRRPARRPSLVRARRRRRSRRQRSPRSSRTRRRRSRSPAEACASASTRRSRTPTAA